MKKYYLSFLLIGIAWFFLIAGYAGPEQYSEPQRIVKTVDDGLTWAQIFYYTGGGIAGLAVAIKTLMVYLKRRKK